MKSSKTARFLTLSNQSWSYQSQEKPLLGKAEAATHYLNSTDFIALHNTITAWCANVRCCMIFS